jgi:beta-glucanase (GH16 family)
VWIDDFDGPAGAPPSPVHWSFETGGGGWGDEQLQTYTEANARLDGEGRLAITARREEDGTITSARLHTKGKVTARHARVEASIRVPAGGGLWPAFWMLGEDIDEVGWPACGEIDVMEHVGSEPHAVHGTIHLPGHAGVGRGLGAAHRAPEPLAGGFHVYGVEWTEERITWELDGKPWAARERGAAWPFDHDFHLLLNLAVGGRWPGNETDDPSLPATMLVEWVRVV